MNAIGMVEVFGLVKAIDIADQCLKAANVGLIGIEKVSSGILTVKIIGDVGAVTSSVDSIDSDKIISHSVIPYMYEETLSILEDSSKNIFNNVRANGKNNRVTENIGCDILRPESISNNISGDTNAIEGNIQAQKMVEAEKDGAIDTFESVSEPTEGDTVREILAQKTVKELVELAVSKKNLSYKDAKRLKKNELIDMLSAQ